MFRAAFLSRIRPPVSSENEDYRPHINPRSCPKSTSSRTVQRIRNPCSSLSSWIRKPIQCEESTQDIIIPGLGICHLGSNTKDDTVRWKAKQWTAQDGKPFLGLLLIDGHGRPEVASFLEKRLLEASEKKSMSSTWGLKSSLKELFNETEEELKLSLLPAAQMGFSDVSEAGASAVVVIATPNRFIIARTGDTGVSKATGLRMAHMSKEHSNTTKERFGYFGTKDVGFGTTSQTMRWGANVAEFARTTGDAAIVIASNGLWDNLSDSEIHDTIKQGLMEEASSQDISDRLLKKTQLKGKNDKNMTILILKL